MGKIARLVPALFGMGDGVWLIPILKALHRTYDALYVETPWPQMYQGFDWIKVLDPTCADGPYSQWSMFRESIDSIPQERWVTSVPIDAEEIRVCETGDYSTRLRSFYDFEGDADLSFPLKSEWFREAGTWLTRETWRDYRPQVLLHIPFYHCGRTMDDPAFARYCKPHLFADLYEAYHERVRFFDAQRVKHFENYPGVRLPMPLYQSDGGGAPILWALASLADAIVTTDNHMLPLALAFQKPTLYLAGSVPTEYLFDPRIDASTVEIVPQGATTVGDAFERVLARVGR